MRKWSLFLTLYFTLCLLAGCAAGKNSTTPDPPPDSGSSPVSGETAELTDHGPWFVTARIVSGELPGTLLLAEHGAEASSVYTLSAEALTFEPEFKEPLRSGQLINIYYDSFTEGWPMNFGGVTAIELPEHGFDDRCALYLRVLEDLWEKDSGLNGGVEVIGVDLSQTSLNPAERSAVAMAFAANHGVELLEDSLESLTEQGVITAHPLTSSGSGTDPNEPKYYFYEWENGIHFSITEQEMEGVYHGLIPVTFTARKWRSSLGAYWFSDCTAVQSALGEWSDYSIGSEMIS